MNVIDRSGSRATPLQPQDRRQLAELVEAVCEHRLNAMVVCAQELRLELIGVHLARALRQAPQVRMELYLPSSTDGLLARFNAILNDLPLVAARTPVQVRGDLRVWVLHLTQERELPEVQVLMRLVQSFPGAGVRLLLLLSREVAEGPLTGLLGGRMHRWWVEDETPDGLDEPAAAAPRGSDGKAVSDEAWWLETLTANRAARARRLEAQAESAQPAVEIPAGRAERAVWTLKSGVASALTAARTPWAQGLRRWGSPRAMWAMAMGALTLTASAFFVHHLRSAKGSAAPAQAPGSMVKPSPLAAPPVQALPAQTQPVQTQPMPSPAGQTPAVVPASTHRAVPEFVEYEDRGRGGGRRLGSTAAGLAP